MPHIYVDADACPVKSEVYRVAARYQLEVTLVTNRWMRTPENRRILLILVEDNPDAADHWIAEQCLTDDIVITADIPLAVRCLDKGGHVVSPTGKRFTDSNIGQTLATRNLLSDLRSAGAVTGGPPPMQKQDRSRFLRVLDEVIQSVQRKNPAMPG